MRWAVATLVLIIACTGGVQTTTTTSPCAEAQRLWDQAQRAIDELSQMTLTEPTPLSLYPHEQHAVLAELFPDCFTIEQRVTAEVVRRVLLRP